MDVLKLVYWNNIIQSLFPIYNQLKLNENWMEENVQNATWRENVKFNNIL